MFDKLAKQISSIVGVNRERARPKQAQGESGNAVVGGYVQEFETNSKLTGRQKYTIYSDILVNVAIVSAGVRYFLNLISSAKWDVEPYREDEDIDPTPQAEEVARLVLDIMGDMKTPWHRVVRRAAMYRFYGFSVQEWIAKTRSDGIVGYDDIQPRPQITVEQWDIENDEVVGIVQRGRVYSQELYVPRAKLIYMVDDSLSDSPEGLGLFRHLVKPSSELQRFEQLEGFGFETDLKGVPIARAPLGRLDEQVQQGDITQAQRASILQPLKDFILKHIKNPSLGMMLDSQTYETQDEAGRPSNAKLWDLELLRSDGTAQSQTAIDNAIKRKTREIARILNVEGLLLGDNSTGSEALARDKTRNTLLIAQSSLQEIVETMQRDFLDPLMDLNGWSEEVRPELTTDSLRLIDVTEISAVLRDMASAGATLMPDDPVINDVREMLGVSKADFDQLFADAALRGADILDSRSRQRTDDEGQTRLDNEE